MSKGGAGEWAVIRALTKWITGTEKPEIFDRSAMSGGKATISKLSGHTMEGDLVAIDRRGFFLTERFVIEVKNRKAANVLDLMDTRKDCVTISKGKKTKGKRVVKNDLYCWWVETCKIAYRAGKRPILVFKRYGSRHWYIVMRSDDFYNLIMFNQKACNNRMVISFDKQRPSCSVLRLDNFTDTFSIEAVKQFPILNTPKLRRIK